MGIHRPVRPEPGPGAQQHFRDAQNINHMVERAQRTGVVGSGDGKRQAVFGDFSAYDFQEAQNMVAQMRSNFLGLKASIRSFFSNDPLYMLKWLEDPVNHPKAVRMGLMVERPKPPVVESPDQLDLVKQAEKPFVEEDDLDGFIDRTKADPEAQPQRSPAPSKGARRPPGKGGR